MLTNVLWVALYIGLIAAVGGAAYYIGDDRGEKRGRQEAALSDDDTRYFDASVAKLVQLGLSWDGSEWSEATATPQPAAGGSSTTASLPDRTSCSEIDSTPYRSLDERSFFLTNCVSITVTPTAECGSPPNPWCYDFFPGELIDSPPADFCEHLECVDNFWAGTGYVVRCNDGAFSRTGGTSAACSGNDGVRQPLYSH